MSHTAFLGNKDYWTGVRNNASFTAIRREFAELIAETPKLVVSDRLTAGETAPWTNTRIVARADAAAALAALKRQPGKDIVLFAGRVLAGTLVGVSPFDPTILLAVAGGLALVTLAACYIPARRVTGIEPASALRQE